MLPTHAQKSSARWQARTLAAGVAGACAGLAAAAAADRGGTPPAGLAAAAAVGGVAFAVAQELHQRRSRATCDRDRAVREAAAMRRLHAARQLHDLGTQPLGPPAAPVADPGSHRPNPHAIAFTTDASRTGRAELRRLLGPPARARASAQAGGLSELDTLVAPLAKAGSAVQIEIRGEVRPLLPAIDLTAYHVVREALLAFSSPRDAATYLLRLNFRPAALLVEIEVEPAAAGRRPWPGPAGRQRHHPAPPGGARSCHATVPGAAGNAPAGAAGPDLSGLYRRVAVYGGKVTVAPVGPEGAGTRITVRLPIHNGPALAQHPVG